MKQNSRRGIIRLTIVSGAWFILWTGILAYLYYRYAQARSILREEWGQGIDAPTGRSYDAMLEATRFWGLQEAALLVALGVPIVCLMISPLIIWCYRGFVD